MALTRTKYRRVSDLYVTGTEVVLKDGTVMWLQVLNPFQVEEARHAAQVARSRLIMALQEHGGDEIAFIDSALWVDGIEGARKRVVDSKSSNVLMEVITGLKDDPDWSERMEIMDRTDETEQPLEGTERELMLTIQRDYVTEVQRRLEVEEGYLTEQFKNATEDELREEYKRLYIDRRGDDIANAEFRLNEIWYGARVCEGVCTDDVWDHSACEGHELQVYEDKAEVRMLPEDLGELLTSTYVQLAMSLRDAKDLARLASSSDSSRQPNEGEASTPSTPVETPTDAPGTSPQPSLTPSPS